jgi:hypothetical protein
MDANTAEIANSTELKPVNIPTDVASDVTSAVCELGIPPLRMKKPRSRRLSLIRPPTTLSVCATNQEVIAISRVSLINTFKKDLA